MTKQQKEIIEKFIGQLKDNLYGDYAMGRYNLRQLKQFEDDIDYTYEHFDEMSKYARIKLRGE